MKVNKYIRILGILICLFLLVLVRKFETTLFYDPFLSFYKALNYKDLEIPDFKLPNLLGSLLFRFLLNSILSIGIIYLWFRDKGVIKVVGSIFAISFIVFASLYILSIATNFSLGYMPTFYIRRILIQPILLFILIPAIYYYKYTQKG